MKSTQLVHIKYFFGVLFQRELLYELPSDSVFITIVSELPIAIRGTELQKGHRVWVGFKCTCTVYLLSSRFSVIHQGIQMYETSIFYSKIVAQN